MSSLLNPRAVERIKAAFDTCELVARTVQARRQIVRKLRPKAASSKAATPTTMAAPPRTAAGRTKMIYEGGTVRIVPDHG